jgi:NAD(P)-dependent dehydrogenase (short-subunit alcohol dehydrogenase family)
MSNIIVTGAFGTLGRAVIAELGARGYGIAALDLAPAPDDVADVMALGGVDLTDADSVATAFDAVAQQLGSIDGLVNVAGGFVWQLVAGTGIAQWEAMQRINLHTAVLASQAVLKHMQAGAIVNVGAAGAVSPAAGMAAYAAAKAGVMALTESLADELKPHVRVNAVLPTILDTPANRNDMPEADHAAWVRPAAAAKVIAFLLSDDAAAVTGAGIRLSLPG